MAANFVYIYSHTGAHTSSVEVILLLRAHAQRGAALSVVISRNGGGGGGGGGGGTLSLN